MVIVLFRSRLRAGMGEEYERTAQRMLELASSMPGFVAFKTFAAPDGESVSIAEYESEEAVRAWYTHPEHLKAQQRGRELFYEDYRIEVCTVGRAYGFAREETEKP